MPLGLPRLAVRGSLAVVGLFGDAMGFCHKYLSLLDLELFLRFANGTSSRRRRMRSRKVPSLTGGLSPEKGTSSICGICGLGKLRRLCGRRNHIAPIFISFSCNRRMARRSQSFAIVPLVLSVLTGGCRIATRPCAPGDWQYHSSGELRSTCCQQRNPAQCMPKEQELARRAPRDAAFARKLVARASDHDGRLCDWEESDRRPPPKPNPPRKQPVTAVQYAERVPPPTPVAAKSAAKPAAPAAPLPNHTPFNWGYFGAVTR